MTKAATKPPANELYDSDFYAWTQEQAKLLRERRWEDLDLDNLVDEVESVGKSDKREIRNRLEILLAHLLKWQHQPGSRGASWRSTIMEQRRGIAAVIEDSPSLRTFARDQVGAVYGAARVLAARETGIALGLFLEECPFAPEQVLDQDFLPENPATE